MLRAYLFTTPRKTFTTRMLNQMSFAVSAFFRGLFAPSCDVILVTSPPLFVGTSAWLLSHLKAAPYVLDVRDYWPHAAVALGQLNSRTAVRLAEKLEMFLYTHAAWIVAVTGGMGYPRTASCSYRTGPTRSASPPGRPRTGTGETARGPSSTAERTGWFTVWTSSSTRPKSFSVKNE